MATVDGGREQQATWHPVTPATWHQVWQCKLYLSQWHTSTGKLRDISSVLPLGFTLLEPSYHMVRKSLSSHVKKSLQRTRPMANSHRQSQQGGHIFEPSSQPNAHTTWSMRIITKLPSFGVLSHWVLEWFAVPPWISDAGSNQRDQKAPKPETPNASPGR